jgi:hypothetical protein
MDSFCSRRKSHHHLGQKHRLKFGRSGRCIFLMQMWHECGALMMSEQHPRGQRSELTAVDAGDEHQEQEQ